jgi:hypothetical protein
VPLRNEYEADIKKYKALFPIKETDIAEEVVTINTIYQYGEVIS